MMIEREDDGKTGVFFIKEKNEWLAEMDYIWSEAATIIITHTEVDDSLQGQGVGKQLVEEGVAFARERGIKIIPRCPFAKAIFDKTPAFKDVLTN